MDDRTAAANSFWPERVDDELNYGRIILTFLQYFEMSLPMSSWNLQIRTAFFQRVNLDGRRRCPIFGCTTHYGATVNSKIKTKVYQLLESTQWRRQLTIKPHIVRENKWRTDTTLTCADTTTKPFIRIMSIHPLWSSRNLDDADNFKCRSRRMTVDWRWWRSLH